MWAYLLITVMVSMSTILTLLADDVRDPGIKWNVDLIHTLQCMWMRSTFSSPHLLYCVSHTLHSILYNYNSIVLVYDIICLTNCSSLADASVSSILAADEVPPLSLLKRAALRDTQKQLRNDWESTTEDFHYYALFTSVCAVAWRWFQIQRRGWRMKYGRDDIAVNNRTEKLLTIATKTELEHHALARLDVLVYHYVHVCVLCSRCV